MNFIDAVNEMQSGKRLIRPIWSGYYITVLSNQSYMWSIPNSNPSQTVNAIIYTPNVDDIQATDWQIKTK